MSIENQIAVITGAGRGLGRAIALRLAREGVRVALCARSNNELEGVCREIQLAGGKAMFDNFDITNYNSVQSFLDQVRSQWGCIDMLINNAGMGFYKPLMEHSVEEIDQIIDTNLKGTIYMCKAVLSEMVGRKQGQILNIGSDLSRRPLANMATYVGAKHGVLGFSASLAREVKGDRVKVMTLNSGIVDTSFGGSEADSREETWSLKPEALADVAHSMLTQGPYVLMDEVTVHPLQQDF